MPAGVYNRKIKSNEERFWSKVNKNGPLPKGNILKLGPCWQWIAGCGNHGYGQINTLVNGKRVIRTAHSFSYELATGLSAPSFESGLTIDHVCRNRRCVNPKHFEIITRGANVLRGESLMAQNARKTHCIRGHKLSGSNVYYRPKGTRECRTCMQAREAKRVRN